MIVLEAHELEMVGLVTLLNNIAEAVPDGVEDDRQINNQEAKHERQTEHPAGTGFSRIQRNSPAAFHRGSRGFCVIHFVSSFQSILTKL